MSALPVQQPVWLSSFLPEKLDVWLVHRQTRCPVVFENNQAAFDYACTRQKPEILLEAAIPALVLESGTVDHGRSQALPAAPGRQRRRPGALGLHAERGDSATPEWETWYAFRVVKIAPDLPEEASVIGYIAAKLAPVWVEKKGWQVLESYTPANIKPTVRW